MLKATRQGHHRGRSLLSTVAMLVFSRAEWQEEHTERHLTNTDEVTPRVSCHKLPADIDRYQLTGYSDRYCKVCLLAVTVLLVVRTVRVAR